MLSEAWNFIRISLLLLFVLCFFISSLHAAMTVARTHKPGSHGNFNEIRFYDKLIGISVDPIKKIHIYLYTCMRK